MSWMHVGYLKDAIYPIKILPVHLVPSSPSPQAWGPWQKLFQDNRAIRRIPPEVHNQWSTSCTKPLIGMRFVWKLAMQWGDYCGACVDINGGEMQDSCVEAKIRDCSWILWLWNSVFVDLVIREGSCLFECTAATAAHDNVMNACRIS
jgi:hypothetical protein